MWGMVLFNVFTSCLCMLTWFSAAVLAFDRAAACSEANPKLFVRWPWSLGKSMYQYFFIKMILCKAIFYGKPV